MREKRLEEVWKKLHSVSMQMHRCQRIASSGLELQRGQGRLLRILSKEDGVSQNQLANILKISPASLSELIVKLEEKEHVVRERDEKDLRKYKIYITESGLKMAEEVYRLRREVSHKYFGVLDDLDLDKIEPVLDKLLKLNSEKD